MVRIKRQWGKIIGLVFLSGIAVLAAIWYVAMQVHVERTVLGPDAVSAERQPDGAVIYTLQLEPPPDSRVYCLMFKSKGNIIDIRAGEQTVYTYGHAARASGRDIGRIYVSAPIPPAGYAQPVTVRLTPHDANASGTLHKLELCPQSEATRYYLTNDTLGLPLALLFIAIGCCSIGAALIIGRRWALSRLAVLFGALLLCVSVELLDTGGHYLIFFTDQYAWNVLFYLVSYLLPVVCPLFFYTLIENQFSDVQRRILRIGMLGNLLFGLTAVVLVLATPLRFGDFARGYSYSLIYGACFAVYGVCLIIRKRLMSKTAMLFTLVMVFWLLIASGLSYWAFPLVNLSGAPRLDMETVQAVFIFYAISAMFISAILKNVRERRENELQVLQLEHQLTRSQLRYFAGQMQPHFLYNTLLSIQEVVLDQPVYAARLIGDFTTYLRGCIASISSDAPIPFSRELAHIRAYVHIEEMRLSDRLTVRYAASAEDFLILPLSVQPLVENAIRHGVFGRGPAGGTVTVRSFEQADAWVVEVEDDGVGFDPEAVLSDVAAGERDSHALRNLIFRLEQGLRAAVDIRSVIGSGTVVTVRIPKSSGTDGPRIESEQKR